MNQSDIRGLVRLQTRADSDILRRELVLSFCHEFSYNSAYHMCETHITPYRACTCKYSPFIYILIILASEAE